MQLQNRGDFCSDVGGGGILRTLAEQPTISYGTYRFALFFLFLSCALYVIGGIHNFTDNRTLSSGKQKHGNVSKWPCTPQKAQKISPKSSNCCPRISVGRWGKRQNCWHDFCYCRHLLSMSGECFLVLSEFLKFVALFEFFHSYWIMKKRVSFFMFPKAFVRLKLNLDRPSNIKHFLVYFVC